MKNMKYMALAAVVGFAVSSASAGIVFSDTFNYTANNAMVAEGGWTSHTGTGGSDAGSGFLWGNGNVLEYNYTNTVAAGDVLTLDATVQRDWAGYFYTMTADLWDGSDVGTRLQAATSVQEGSTATAGALSQLTYTVTAADIAAGRDHVIFQYSHSTNWGETQDVSFGVTAIPEPATLGLVAVCGGCILFIRRKLLI